MFGTIRSGLIGLAAVLLLAACSALPFGADNIPPSPLAITPVIVIPTQTVAQATPTLAATRTAPPASVTPALSVSPTPSPVPGDLSISLEQVLLYPAGTIYEGEAVTVQVWAHVPDDIVSGQVEVQLYIDGELIETGKLSPRILGGDEIGDMVLFPWSWDSWGQAGSHLVEVRLDPQDRLSAGDENHENNTVAVPLTVQPLATARQERAVLAQWLAYSSACCTLHVIEGSAAHRDIEQLYVIVDEATAEAAEKLQVIPERPIHYYFADRVIGQGGYATGNIIIISYLDRSYSGNGLREVILHESVHALDTQFAPNRLGFLAEGLAVWVTGGHYKSEDLMERMAALVEIGRFVPLAQLIENFMLTQHEIGYLEAAGFMSYLVDNYGWEAVREFYADTNSNGGETVSQAVDDSLQRHFQISLGELELEWLASLERVRPSQDVIDDLNTSIRYFDTMRFYQKQYDPTAHFLLAWLPSPLDLEERGLTAELARHPEEVINITLEVMLVDADLALRNGNYNRVNVILDSVERTLSYQGAFLDPLGSNYSKIVQTMLENGYQVHQVNLQGNQALVQATRGENPRLFLLQLVLNSQNWVFTQ
jgi:hypothetical protein